MSRSVARQSEPVLGPGRWIGWILALLLTLSASVAPSASARTASGGRPALFQRAAQQSGVPLPLLVGLAWEQSFLSNHHGRPSVDDGYGLLDLSARRDHNTLGAAARLVHASTVALRQSDALNLLGGALLLARYERRLNGRLPSAIGDWTPAVVAFTGMRSRLAARLVADDLYRSLRQGIDAGGVHLTPLPTAWPRLRTIARLHATVQTRQTSTGSADFPGAIWEPASSRNYTPADRPKGHVIRFIVIHDTEGSCPAAVNTFENPASQASAHYVVCLDGTIIQMVHEHDIAWHAGNWPVNQQSIGIEHEGYADGAYYTRAQYLASAALVRYLCHKYGLSANRNVIFGHENVPAASHTDPGPYWNWSFYMERVRHDATGYSGGATAVAVVTSGSSVQSCPATSCDALGSANWGEQFAVMGEQPGWEEIAYAGHIGWIAAADVAAGSGYLLKTRAMALLRAGPSDHDGTVGTVPAGQTYVSTVRDGAFWYVAYNHRYGFLPSSAVRTVNCLSPHIIGCIAPSGTNVAVMPDASSPGLTVTVAGTGLAPKSAVNVSVGDQTLQTAHTGRSGAFSAVVLLPPALLLGEQTIVATDAQGTSIQTPLQIQPAALYSPRLTLSQSAALPGSREKVGGSGFPPEAAVTLSAHFPLLGSATKSMVIHTFSQPNGALAAVKLTIPPSTLPGTYNLIAGSPGSTGQQSLTVTTPPIGTPTATVSPTPEGS